MSKTVLGIDISKATFDIVLLHRGQERHAWFDNDVKGFAALSAWLARHDAGQRQEQRLGPDHHHPPHRPGDRLERRDVVGDELHALFLLRCCDGAESYRSGHGHDDVGPLQAQLDGPAGDQAVTASFVVQGT